MKKTIIIAEVGECWNGDIDQAKKLIKLAADSGCDYVKFQTLDKETIANDDPERGWFLRIALSDEMVGFIINYANKNRIRSLFTPANLEKAKLLKEKFKLNDVKIASSVFNDRKTVKYAADNFKRVFLSTGMHSLREVKSRIRFFDNSKGKIYIMHCISEYPTGPLLNKTGLRPLAEEDAHLNMMRILKEEFPKYKIGYSDHTLSTFASICAVAAGADVIEKHITLDRGKPIRLFKSGKGYSGTDHILSLEPDELRGMVRQIRVVEKIFGEWRWQRTDGEKILRDFLIGRF